MKAKLILVVSVLLCAFFMCGAACDHSFEEWQTEGEEMSALCTRCGETITTAIDREQIALTRLLGKWASPEDDFGISHTLTFMEEGKFERSLILNGMEKPQSGTWSFEGYEEKETELDGIVDMYNVSLTADNGTPFSAQLICSDTFDTHLLIFTIGEGEFAIGIFMIKPDSLKR